MSDSLNTFYKYYNDGRLKTNLRNKDKDTDFVHFCKFRFNYK